jgi:hypothetical protein
VRQRLRLIPRATVIRNANACSAHPKAMNRASKLSRFMLLPSGRVMLSANATGKCQRSSSNPAQSTPRPPGRCGFATLTLRSCCPPTPSPASPHVPCRTSSARLMQIPRRSRAHNAAPAPRQRLPQAGCRVSPPVGRLPRCRASGFVTANGEGSRSQRLSPAKARTK